MVSRAQRIRLAACAVVVVIVMWGLISTAAGATGSAGGMAHSTPKTGTPVAGPPSPLGTPVHPYPDGVPMVHPHSTQQPGPNFSAADVTTALHTYRMLYQKPGSPSLQLTSFECLTAAQVSQQLHAYVGRPPTALVCLGHVSGDFFPPHPTHSGTTPTFHDGLLVIDAVTGNVLIEGVSAT